MDLRWLRPVPASWMNCVDTALSNVAALRQRRAIRPLSFRVGSGCGGFVTIPRAQTRLPDPNAAVAELVLGSELSNLFLKQMIKKTLNAASGAG
jgi:hypothetical protein